jgi:hypothetical protein
MLEKFGLFYSAGELWKLTQKVVEKSAITWAEARFIADFRLAQWNVYPVESCSNYSTGATEGGPPAEDSTV